MVEGIAYYLPVERTLCHIKGGYIMCWYGVRIRNLCQAFHAAHIEVATADQRGCTDVFVGQCPVLLVIGDKLFGGRIIREQPVVGADPNASQGICLQQHDIREAVIEYRRGFPCGRIKLL